MGDLVYRVAQIEDFSQIVQMKNAVKARIIEQGLAIWQNGYPTDETIVEDIAQNEGRVVEFNGEIIAYSVFYHCTREYDNAFKNSNNLQSFGRIMVRNDFLGKKIGDFLVSSMIAEAKTLSVDGMGITVDAINTVAVNLYKKHGFIREGERQFPWAYLDIYALYFN